MKVYKYEDASSKIPNARITIAEEQKLFDALDNYSNPELKQIVLLSLATAMRRSEIVTLTWQQIDFENRVINLFHTKGGGPRKVVMTNEALSLLQKLEVKDPTDKLFSYRVSGFEGSYRKFLEAHKIKNLNFHRMRKEAFTRFFENIGDGSTTLLAKYLGIKNVVKFKKSHEATNLQLKTEADILRSGGHKNAQVTSEHYLSTTPKA